MVSQKGVAKGGTVRRGYARVSTEGQATQPQEEVLSASGVEVLYVEHASGGRWDRPEMQRLLGDLEEGDVLVVWKIDRAARSLHDLLRLLAILEERGCGFQSLTEDFDTTAPAGRMVLQVMGAFAEFERGILVERTRRGMESARSRKVHLGRPRGLTELQADHCRAMVSEGVWTAADAAEVFGVHRSTIYRVLKRG